VTEIGLASSLLVLIFSNTLMEIGAYFSIKEGKKYLFFIFLSAIALSAYNVANVIVAMAKGIL